MKNLLYLTLFCIAFSAHSQSELWTRKVSNEAFMSQLDDGKIFIKENAKISLINNKTGDIEWENKVSTKDDPRFLDNLPIMYFDGKSYAVIDASTGMVIDESKVKSKILNISYFWDIGRVVIEMDRAKNLHILSIDLANLSNSWNTKIGPVQKTMFGLASRASNNQPSITKDGSMVLVDKKYISLVDIDGNVTERIEYKKKIKKLGYNQEKDILYVIEDNKKLHFVDVKSGKTNSTIKMKEDELIFNVVGDGSNIAVAQKKKMMIFDGVSGKEKGLHKFKNKIKHVYIDEESDRLFVLSKKMLAEVDHNTGSIIKEVAFKKDFDDMYKIFDKTIISGNSGASPINLSTFKLDYAKIPNVPPVHDYVEMGNFIGYTNQTSTKFSLHVVDQKGKVVWKKSYASVNTPSLDVIGDGILIVSDSEVNYLSVKDGKLKWDKKVKVRPSFAYGIDEETEDMFMYSDKRLFKFGYADGSISKSEDKFNFRDFDYEMQSPQLMVLKDAIFLKGSNTIYVLSKDGKLIHKKTYKRVSNASVLLKLANFAVTATAMATGNTGKVVTVYQNDRMVHKGEMVDGLNNSWALSERLKDERRAKQNRSSNAFPYVFCKMEDDSRGLIFINPSTGDERFSVLLEEKDPFYIVDEIDGTLFHLTESSLKAYDLR